MSIVSFAEQTLDDAMRSVFSEILDKGIFVEATKGSNYEISGVLLEIANPRARVSSTESRSRPFSCLGELCWYLSGSDATEQIAYYIDHYKKQQGSVSGAYGPRLFRWNGVDQIANTIETLRKKPNSRQAVIQLFDHRDLIVDTGDVPCTCTLQLLVREGALHLITHMRSNDAYLGFPHDVFCFTMLQEIIACKLGVELGSYKHMVGSMHLYEADLQNARLFLSEGWQSHHNAMPPMPTGDPQPAIDRLLEVEEDLREGRATDYHYPNDIDAYWNDLIQLLLAFSAMKRKDASMLEASKQNMSIRLYNHSIDRLKRFM